MSLTGKMPEIEGLNLQQPEPSADFKRGYMQCSMDLGGQVRQQNIDFVSLLIVVTTTHGKSVNGLVELRVDPKAGMTMPPGTALQRMDDKETGELVFRVLPPELAAQQIANENETGP